MAQKICDKYDILTPLEKSMFMGELVHVAQSDDAIFDLAKGLIELGISKGLFIGTVIMPTNTETNE